MNWLERLSYATVKRVADKHKLVDTIALIFFGITIMYGPMYWAIVIVPSTAVLILYGVVFYLSAAAIELAENFWILELRRRILGDMGTKDVNSLFLRSFFWPIAIAFQFWYLAKIGKNLGTISVC